jgi:hypothetical protein
MSYSVKTPCGSCVKFGKCVDGIIIAYAVYALHALGEAKGHLGAGSVDLNCTHLEEPKEKYPTSPQSPA